MWKIHRCRVRFSLARKDSLRSSCWHTAFMFRDQGRRLENVWLDASGWFWQSEFWGQARRIEICDTRQAKQKMESAFHVGLLRVYLGVRPWSWERRRVFLLLSRNSNCHALIISFIYMRSCSTCTSKWGNFEPPDLWGKMTIYVQRSGCKKSNLTASDPRGGGNGCLTAERRKWS